MHARTEMYANRSENYKENLNVNLSREVFG